MTGKLIQAQPTPAAQLAWYIVTIDVMSDKPIMQTTWWRVQEIRRGGYVLLRDAAKNGVDVSSDTGSGLWSTVLDGVVVEAWFPGSSYPTHVEESAVPCPKVRGGIETRWHRGEWQKYSKAKGWVRA